MQRAREDREHSRRSAALVASVALLAAIFTAGSFVAPLLRPALPSASGLLGLVYSPLCHQNPERSLVVGGGRQAVCARCSGLYLGGVAGLLLAAGLVAAGRLRARPLWLVVVAIPTLIDALLPWVGAPGLGNVPRLLLALPVGLVAGLFLARGLEDLLDGGRGLHAKTGSKPARTGRYLEVIDG